MKILIYLMLAVATVGVAEIAQDSPPPAPANQAVGRFQIIYAQTLDANESPKPLVIRLDTATGQTWKYLPFYSTYRDYKGEKRNMLAEGWVPITENIMFASQVTERVVAQDKLPPSPSVLYKTNSDSSKPFWLRQ